MFESDDLQIVPETESTNSDNPDIENSKLLSIGEGIEIYKNSYVLALGKREAESISEKINRLILEVEELKEIKEHQNKTSRMLEDLSNLKLDKSACLRRLEEVKVDKEPVCEPEALYEQQSFTVSSSTLHLNAIFIDKFIDKMENDLKLIQEESILRAKERLQEYYEESTAARENGAEEYSRLVERVISSTLRKNFNPNFFNFNLILDECFI